MARLNLENGGYVVIDDDLTLALGDEKGNEVTVELLGLDELDDVIFTLANNETPHPDEEE